MKISKVFPKIRYFDFFSHNFFKIISYIHLNLSFFHSIKNKKKIRIFKNKEYYESRFINNYYTIKLEDNTSFTYKVYNEKGINVAYLIDCIPMTKKSFSKALYEIIRNEKIKIDMILYIGNNISVPYYFLKVPKNKEPRSQKFIGLSFIENDYEFFDINNWAVSLLNFDNR